MCSNTLRMADTQFFSAQLSLEEEKRSTKRSYSDIASQAVKQSLTPLSRRQPSGSHDFSVLSCLSQFTYPELLTGSNKFACTYCNRRNRKAQRQSKGKLSLHCQHNQFVAWGSFPCKSPYELEELSYQAVS